MVAVLAYWFAGTMLWVTNFPLCVGGDGGGISLESGSSDYSVSLSRVTVIGNAASGV
jgi:hypothetical protein